MSRHNQTEPATFSILPFWAGVRFSLFQKFLIIFRGVDSLHIKGGLGIVPGSQKQVKIKKSKMRVPKYVQGKLSKQ
jgi:hypothetical protein